MKKKEEKRKKLSHKRINLKLVKKEKYDNDLVTKKSSNPT